MLIRQWLAADRQPQRITVIGHRHSPHDLRGILLRCAGFNAERRATIASPRASLGRLSPPFAAKVLPLQ